MLKTTVAYLPRNSQHHRYISNKPVIDRRKLQPTGVKIARLCEYDRRLLPRQHPGTSDATDGAHLAGPGAYSRIVAWRSRDHFINVVLGMAIYARGHVLTQHHISRDLFRQWARTESQYANDQRTGRRIIVRADTVATQMACSTRSVQRCRAAARELGLLVDVVHGRRLTFDEAMKAREAGSPQYGIANESAMTVPAWLGKTPWQTSPSGDTVTPLVESPPKKNTYTPDTPRKAKGPPRLPARLTKTKRAPSPATLDARKAARRLAEDLIEKIAFLVGEQPGRLVPSLSRFAHGHHAWTADDIHAHITSTDRMRGRSPLARHDVKTRPAAVLAAYLRDVDPQADHPRFDPHTGLTPPRTVWPTWCGTCDDHTRQIELDDGRMARCPSCHPITVSAPADRPTPKEKP